MAAVMVPARLEAHTTEPTYDRDDGDIDAEGEEDPDVYPPTEGQAQEEAMEDAEASDAVPSDVSEEEDAGDSDEDESRKRPRRLSKGKQKATSEDEAVASVEEDEDSSAAEEEPGYDKDSSDAESAAVEDWEGGSEGGGEAEVEVANRNNCIFCLQDEEHDPSEEFEEYMACAVCGDNSHRQCARDANSLASDEEAENWRCPQCIDNALEPDPNAEEEEEEASRRRRSSASRLTRDLLPAARGTSRPGSHSIFNTLIIDDDPLDGSRSLRKRKTTEEQEDASATPAKRRKPSSSKSHSERATSVAVPDTKATEDAIAEIAEAASVSTRKSRSSRPSRSRRLKSTDPGHVTITTNDRDSILLQIRLNPSRLEPLLRTPPKQKRSRPSRPTRAVEQPEPTLPHRTFTSQYASPFYSFHEKENDELKSKPYGGVLSEEDAQTIKTLPLQADRAKFLDAKSKADEEWAIKIASAEAELESKPRSSQKVSGPPSKIKCVAIGGYEIETWYAAPYPEEYSRNRVLFICEFCLKYMNSDYVAWRHKLKCPAKHPPGDEIYRDKSISVFEVDGRKNPVYCQNLCLLAKLFLGSKTLYYDVEPFLFYVMTEYDDLGCHFVGYFSKEKRPSSQNNVSCILTLPTHQRKGYGNLLISFSYLLTRAEGKTGSPEKPLSDMGLVSYRNYWRLVLSYELYDQKKSLSIVDLSNRTGMTADDIVAALEALRALVRDPVTKSYALRLDRNYLKQCIETWEAKGYVTLNHNALVWTPYIMGRSNLSHYDHAPALPTIAPREGENDDKTIMPEEGVQQSMNAAATTNGESSKTNGVTPTTEDAPSKLTRDPSQQSAHIVEASSPAFGPSDIPANIDSHTIPPYRYEVFPPIPGTAARNRRGANPRSTARRSKPGAIGSPAVTPIRRNHTKASPRHPATGRTSRGSTSAPPASERKTRSSMRDGQESHSQLVAGLDGTMEEESESEDEAMADEDAGSGAADDAKAEKQLLGAVPLAVGDEERDGEFEADEGEEDAEGEDEDED